MEIDPHRITVVHKDEVMIKIFDNVNEALLFAEGARTFKTKVSVDPLYNFIYRYSQPIRLD